MLNAAFKDRGLLVESKIQQIDGSRKKETFLGIVRVSELEYLSLLSWVMVVLVTTQFSCSTLRVSSSVGLGGVWESLVLMDWAFYEKIHRLWREQIKVAIQAGKGWCLVCHVVFNYLPFFLSCETLYSQSNWSHQNYSGGGAGMRPRRVVLGTACRLSASEPLIVIAFSSFIFENVNLACYILVPTCVGVF